MKHLFLTFLMLLCLQACAAEGKPFNGVWESRSPEEDLRLCIDLYGKTMKTPDGSADSYGYLEQSNDFVMDFWVISDILSVKGNEAKVKVFSWRYGTPDDKQEAVLTYDPTKKTMIFKRSDSPIVFKDAPEITKDILGQLYRNADIEADHEFINLSFYPKGDKWLLEESHATYYGEGRSKYINTAAFLGTLQGNKIVLTHEAYGFMLNIDEVNEGNMEKMASPYTLYYMPQSKAFMRNDGQVYILQ